MADCPFWLFFNLSDFYEEHPVQIRNTYTQTFILLGGLHFNVLFNNVPFPMSDIFV